MNIMSTASAIKKLSSVPDASNKTKQLFIAGVGAVGGTLLKQVYTAKNRLPQSVAGICNSKRCLWYDDAFENYTPSDLLKGKPKNWDEIIGKLKSLPGGVIFADATGSPEVAKLYAELLKSGIHVVTPSKLANSGTQEHYRELHNIAGSNGVQFLYETNVGAGLPVIHSIKNMIDTGDEILEISGVLSGTMTYIFSELDKGEPFSKTLIKARNLGYAEPDPRDDLSGEDVARKFLILARTVGLEIEREEIEVENLVPEFLKNADSATFLNELNQFDEEWAARFKHENAKGYTVRYTGRLKNGRVEVGTEAVPISSPLGQLTGTNNLVVIKSRRYNDQPLIIQGPGAGKEVTAAGVLGDILSIR